MKVTSRISEQSPGWERGALEPTVADRRAFGRAAGGVALLVALVGCHGPQACDRACVSRDVAARTGHAVGSGPSPDQVIVPDSLATGRPLAEDEAVVLALWNNAAFHEALVELDLTRADLVQAGLLPNPEVFYSWPVPDRVFRYLF